MYVHVRVRVQAIVVAYTRSRNESHILSVYVIKLLAALDWLRACACLVLTGHMLRVAVVLTLAAAAACGQALACQLWQPVGLWWPTAWPLCGSTSSCWMRLALGASERRRRRSSRSSSSSSSS